MIIARFQRLLKIAAPLSSKRRAANTPNRGAVRKKRNGTEFENWKLCNINKYYAIRVKWKYNVKIRTDMNTLNITNQNYL